MHAMQPSTFFYFLRSSITFKSGLSHSRHPTPKKKKKNEVEAKSELNEWRGLLSLFVEWKDLEIVSLFERFSSTQLAISLGGVPSPKTK